MRETAKEMLADVVDFLNRAPSPEIHKLWAVLTALRGPDSQKQEAAEAKTETTSKLRFLIGLQTKYLYNPKSEGIGASTAGADVCQRPINPEVATEMAASCGGHFLTHFRSAYAALDDMGLLEKEPAAHKAVEELESLPPSPQRGPQGAPPS